MNININHSKHSKDSPAPIILEEVDAMDIDEAPVPVTRDPLLVAFLMVTPEAEAVQTLENDPQRFAQFRKALSIEPNEKPVAKKLVQVSSKLLQADELPGWVSRFSLPRTPLSLIEIVQQGREDLLDEQQEMTPAEWLAIRTNLGDSLLHIAIDEKHFTAPFINRTNRRIRPLL